MSSEVNPEVTDHSQMSLIEHLRELRVRLIRALMGVLVGFSLCWNYSEQIFDFLRKPIAKYLSTSGLVYTGVMDKFMAHMKVAIFAGVILSAPFWLYQIWLFIAPALYKKEKKYAVLFLTFGTVLFLLGISFSYYLALPSTLDYLMTFGGDVDKPMITISDYLSFFVIMILVFGVIFEMPLILTILGVMGVIDSKLLSGNRRYAAVIMSIVAAVVTPSPDAFSMLLVLVPMYMLFELSIVLIKIFAPKKS